MDNGFQQKYTLLYLAEFKVARLRIPIGSRSCSLLHEERKTGRERLFVDQAYLIPSLKGNPKNARISL